jgi:PAS domain S-box-containing protein
VLNAVNDGYWEWDVPSGRITLPSPRWYRIVGYEPGQIELCIEAFTALIHPDDRERVEGTLRRLIESGPGADLGPGADRYEIQHRIRSADGAWRWLLSRGQVSRRGADGRAARISGAITDITELRRVKGELAESEERYRWLFESLQEGFSIGEVILGGDGKPGDIRYLEVNEAFCRLTGFSREEIARRTDRELFLHRDPFWEEAFGKVALTGEPLLFERESPELGKTFRVYAFSPERGKFAVLFFDVSEQRRAGEKLQAAQERLQSFLEQAPVAVCVAEAGEEGEITYLNPASVALTGYSREDIPTLKAWHEKAFPDPVYRAQAVASLRLDTEEGYRTRQGFYRVTCKDGTVKDLQFRGRFLRDGTLITFANDVSEVRRIERALRESEQRCRAIFNTARDALVLVDDQAALIEVNPAAAAFFSLQEQELVGHRATDFIRLGSMLETIWAPFLRDRHFQGETRVAHADGTIRDVEVLGIHHILPGQHLFVLHDVSERLRVEEALLRLNATLERQVAERSAEAEERAQKLQALALQVTEAEERERRRIAEILHDELQQILVSTGFKVAILQRVVREEPSLVLLRNVSQLLHDAIQVSRRLSHELYPPPLHRFGLLPALQWLARQMKEKHALEVQLEGKDESGEPTPENEALHTFLFRAVRELLFNVVKHAGILSARVRVARCGEQLQVEVADEGRGFDPRPVEGERGPSTGLGLFQIDERIGYFGGRLEVVSAPGRGSRFILSIPMAARTKTQPPAREPAAVVAPASEETGAGRSATGCWWPTTTGWCARDWCPCWPASRTSGWWERRPTAWRLCRKRGSSSRMW